MASTEPWRRGGYWRCLVDGCPTRGQRQQSRTPARAWSTHYLAEHYRPPAVLGAGAPPGHPAPCPSPPGSAPDGRKIAKMTEDQLTLGDPHS